MEAINEMERIEAAKLERIAAEENAAAKETVLSGRKPIFHQFINTSFKKAAAVAVITVGVLTLGFGMQSEAEEFALVKFFQQKFCDHIEIEPHEDLRENQVTAQSIEVVYDLSWIPEGYEKKREKINEKFVMQNYYDTRSNNVIK